MLKISLATMLKAAGVETRRLNPAKPTRAMAKAMGIRRTSRPKKAAIPVAPATRELIDAGPPF